jgi:endonuclease G
MLFQYSGMRYINYLYFLLTFGTFVISPAARAQQQAKTSSGKEVRLCDDGTWYYADSVPLLGINPGFYPRLEIPKTGPKEKIITHTGFSLCYNEKHEQASWVAYELTKEETNKVYDRTDKFLPDPKVRSNTATDRDYKNSGYDRGHLAPASDMGWSAASMAASFYYSNMSPQEPGFNRGIWKRLEEQVRNWAIENGALYVVSGPVLTNGLPTIGPSKVSVPIYYYKVILDYTQPGIKGIGFIMPNFGSKDPLQPYVVSIDSVEQLTGIDFFPQLPDDEEALIEKTVCTKCWSWGGGTERELRQKQATASTQCTGTTKAGNRCRSNTLNANGFCHQHQLQAGGGAAPATDTYRAPTQKSSSTVQCSGTTKSGNRCRRMTTSASGRCYQH